ncbi:hypothetical protein HAX54_047828 [Datura stramonium]|uniref:Uncharacterized protein n=1 Tax=Datura stramonium TaxID=4076 RepID=A0ABS8ST31_DATST|nr:hypothetical protein [Datura stramonium]
MIGFEWTAAKFFWYFFIMYFTLLYFTFYGMMTVAITPNQNVASIVAAFFYAVWNLFSGFIVPRPRIPIWWRWYYWACPVAWTFSIFSRSTRDEDDEEALRWAALERLPTFDRMSKGLLFGKEGEASDVDTNDIGHQERKSLLDRLVKVPDEDNEKFLLKLKNRIETFFTGPHGQGLSRDNVITEKWEIRLELEIELPSIEVRYEHLNINADAYVGSRALPTFINFMTNFVEVTGNVTYNGHELHEFVPQKTAVYISQHDLHIGEMTKCWMNYQKRKLLISNPDPDIDIYHEDFGTGYVCADTGVGDEMLRAFQGKRNVSPETYSLFDDIILLSDGYIVYQGPREAVLDFFESWIQMPRKELADFLQRGMSYNNVVQTILASRTSTPDGIRIVQIHWSSGRTMELHLYIRHLHWFYNLHCVDLYSQEIAPNGAEPLGAAVVRARGFFPDAYWYWIAFGKPQAMISEDNENAENVQLIEGK